MSSWQVCRMLWLAEKSGWQPIVAVLAALDKPPLPSETLAACDELYAPLRGIAPIYNR
jgi:hypothetical protein